MNTAIDNQNLSGNLCLECECSYFDAKLSYEVNAQNKTVKVTDQSDFGDDGLKVVNVRVYDKDGNKVSGQITTAGGDATIDVSSLNISSIDITATIVNSNDKTADLGIYNIGSVALSGNLGHTKQ